MGSANSPFLLSHQKWRVTGSANSPFILSHRATEIGNSGVVFSHSKCRVNDKCRVAGITNTLANDRELGKIQVRIIS